MSGAGAQESAFLIAALKVLQTELQSTELGNYFNNTHKDGADLKTAF